MFHIIYKTTNLLDGKFYIGAHSTEILEDGYLGSGKYLKRAVLKYGRENFAREILFVYSDKEQMYSKEREIVTEDFILTNNVYNLKLGGSGGNPGIVGAFAGRIHSEESREKISQATTGRKNSPAAIQRMIDNHPQKKLDPVEYREYMRAIARVPCSEEKKLKLRDAALLQGSKGTGGKKNAGKIRQKYKCQHCDVEAASNVIDRWHNDNCKHKI